MQELYIAETPSAGRGVFSRKMIEKDQVVEICPVIIIPKLELPIIHKTILHDYYFLWGEDLDECAIALGYGSMYNHAVHPNADFILDFQAQTIEIFSVKHIHPGEQITINYHGESGDSSPLWFDF